MLVVTAMRACTKDETAFRWRQFPARSQKLN